MRISLYRTTVINKKILRGVFGISQEKIQLECDKTLDGVMDLELNHIIKSALCTDLDVLTIKLK